MNKQQKWTEDEKIEAILRHYYIQNVPLDFSSACLAINLNYSMEHEYYWDQITLREAMTKKDLLKLVGEKDTYFITSEGRRIMQKYPSGWLGKVTEEEQLSQMDTQLKLLELNDRRKWLALLVLNTCITAIVPLLTGIISSFILLLLFLVGIAVSISIYYFKIRK